MPLIEINDTNFNYQLDGPAAAPVVVFSNGLGTTLAMWELQASSLSSKFRVLRLDTRGHGQSAAPKGPYSIGELGGDLVGLLAALKISKAHFCGISMGGLIGQWLSLNHPDRFTSITITDTALHIGAADMWNARIAKVQSTGLGSVVEAVISRWFTEGFAKSAPRAVQAARAMFVGNSAEGYAACCAAIRDADFTNASPANGEATAVPMLVMTGTHDVVCTPADSQALVAKYPGAKYVELNGGHLSNIEDAAGYTAALTEFISNTEPR